MNEGEYVTDGSYVTPLPRTDVERHLWSLVITLHKAILAKQNVERVAPCHVPVSLSSSSLDDRRSASEARPVNSSSVGSGREVETGPSLQPLAAYLETLTVNRAVRQVGASVVDVVVQLPDAAIRREALRLVLAFPKWCFDVCGPVAVAASRGDVTAVKLLLRDRRLDPNCGFPLTVAVRFHQLEALRCLLASRRIRPNHGSVFYEAVARRDMACLVILLNHNHLNLNRFAKNRGTTPVLHAIRGFMADVPADSAAPGQMTDRLPTATPPPPPLLSDALDEVQQDPSSPPVPAITVTSPSGQKRRVTIGGPARVHCVPITRGSHPIGGDDGEVHSPLSNTLRSSAFDNAGHGDSPLASAPTSSLNPRGARNAWTPASWTEVLTLLLQYPAVDVNTGYYATPLTTAVLTEHVPLIKILLRSAHIKPNRVNPSVKGLIAGMHHFKHTDSTVTETAALLARTPLEVSLERRSARCFELLARDRRVLVPQSVWQKLEQYPESQWVIPFLAILARYRRRWESWAWGWRRACLAAAYVSASVMTVLHWWFLTAWAEEFGTLHVVTTAVVTLLMVPLGLWCLCARSTPCRGASALSSTPEEKPSSDALVTVVVEAAPHCGLPPSVCRWLLWLSLICAPLLPVWPLYSAWLTVWLGRLERGPWQVESTTAMEDERVQSSTAVVAVGSAPVRSDGSGDGGGEAPAPATATATTTTVTVTMAPYLSTDDDARSVASNSTSMSTGSTSTTATLHHAGDDSSLSAAGSGRTGGTHVSLLVPNDAAWGSEHLLHAVRRLSHHHRYQSEDSDGSNATAPSDIADPASDDGAVALRDGAEFILPRASAVPLLSLRAALYGLYDRLVVTNLVISAMSFLVHVNFLFPFRSKTDDTPSVVDAPNRTLLIFAGLACFVCSLVEMTAAATSLLCLRNASPSSLLAGSSKAPSRRVVNQQRGALL